MIYQETEEYEKGFAQYFQDNIADDLKDTENTRRVFLHFFIITSIIVIPIAAFIILGILHQLLPYISNLDRDMPIGFYFLFTPNYFGAFFIGLITYFICSVPNYIYRYLTKVWLMPKVVKFFGDFQYKNNNKINEEIILASNLIPAYTSYCSEDNITGTYKDVSIEMTETKFVNGSDNGTVAFKGIIILLSMNKNFTGKTIVLKDKGCILNFLKEYTSSLEEVNLEDPCFEKLFNVYSSNQVEARYLLTTAFMERLIKLSETFGNKEVQCSFTNNTLIITIPVKKNMFEPASIFKSSYDIQGIKTVLREIYYTLNIIDILKLNEEIGL